MKTLRLPIPALGLSGTILLLAFEAGFAQSDWQQTIPLPVPAYQVGAVAGSEQVFAAGGFNGAALASVSRAPLNADGSLGSWASTTALPQGDPGPGVATYNGRLYALLTNGVIYRAEILPGGGLGSWTAEPGVDPSVSYWGALRAYKEHLYVLGRYDGTFRNEIRIAAINPDGSLGAWQTGALPGPVYRSAFHFYNSRLYMAGGLTSGDTVLNVSLSAFVESDGSIGTWRSESDLPVPLWEHGSVIVSNRICLFGGLTNSTGGSVSSSVYEGEISAADGTIGGWTLSVQMPGTNQVGVAAVFAPDNGRVYLLGGASASGQFSAEVWRKGVGPAPPNQPPVADSQSVTVMQNGSVAIHLTGSDPENQPLTFLVVDAPTNGTLQGTAPDLTYKPNPGFNGGDAFTFKVNDGELDSALATVNLTVLPLTNTPPVARIAISPLAEFPGVAEPIVISENDIDAEVPLDGSDSTDAEGDSLEFSWSEGGNLIGTGVRLTKSFGAGTHTVQLSVSDGLDAGTAEITFHVLSRAQATALVLEMVGDSSLAPNRKQPLFVSLKAAIASFSRGNTNAAVNQLRAFQAKVRAQVARTDSGLASDLIEAAQIVIDAAK